MVLLGAFVCLFAFGTAEGNTLTLTVRDSFIYIKAHEMPLGAILKALSEKTGMSLKLGGELREVVSCDLRAVTLEEAVRRLLANHSHTLTFRKTPDGRFLPEELRLVGVEAAQQSIFKGPRSTVDETRMPPDDPYEKKFAKEWFVQQFGRANKLSDQIAATPYNKGPLAQGILITGISQESALRKIGLRVGDVINNVNGHAVNSAQEFLQVLGSLHEDQPMVRIERGKDDIMEPIYISLQ